MLKDYIVLRITKKQTHSMLKYKHYIHKIPQIMHSFGLFKDRSLMGVCTYGIPPSQNLCKGVCGEEYKHIVLELNRLYLDDLCTKNTASYFIAQTFKMLPQPSIIVSYADTSVGHVGYIYQSLNFLYTGMPKSSCDDILIDGKMVHSRSMHDRSVRGIKLSSTQKIKDFYGDRVEFVPCPLKHRYVHFIGSKKDKSILRRALKYEVLPYPKDESKKYDIKKTPLELMLE